LTADQAEFSGCGGGCACAAKRASGACSSEEKMIDYFSSIALASELLCEPSDDFIDNVRSLWSSLTPGNQTYAAGAHAWDPVNAMLHSWFTSDQLNLDFARGRFEKAFSESSKDKNSPAETLTRLRQQTETISELLYNLAPLFARESFYTARGDTTNADACARERATLINNQLLPCLTFSESDSHLIKNDPWISAALTWAKEVATAVSLRAP